MNAYFGAKETENCQFITCGNNGSNDNGGSSVAVLGGLASVFPMSASIKRIRLTLLPPTSREFKLAIEKPPFQVDTQV
jgi:uncharacterized membrane protein YqiK